MHRLVISLLVTLAALSVAGAALGSSATATADLGVTETASNPTPNVGDTITFTVTLTNHGPSTATGITVFDRLPAGLTFVSATPNQGSYVLATGVWSVGTLANGVSQTLQLQATVASPNALSNAAHVLHSDESNPVATNNSVSATEHPQHADVAITETVSHTTPNVGDVIAFTITITDRGPDSATNLTVTDALPVGLDFVFAVPSQGSFNSFTGIWTVGTVVKGSPQTLELSALVVSPTALTNTPTVSHSDQFDPVPTNNHASVVIHPQQADLGLTETASKPAVNAGDAVVLTVKLMDHGPAAATNVSVSDLLPGGLSFVSATVSRGTYNSGTGVWTVGTVTSGGSAVLTLNTTLGATADETNTAAVSHADQFDPSVSNNSVSSTVRLLEADLDLAQFISNPTPSVGDTILLTVTLTNPGPDTATTVAVSDLLPAGLTLVSATATRGTYKSGTWTVGTLTPGTAATLALHVTIDFSAIFSNITTISHADQFDPSGSNNSATYTFFAA